MDSGNQLLVIPVSSGRASNVSPKVVYLELDTDTDCHWGDLTGDHAWLLVVSRYSATGDSYSYFSACSHLPSVVTES